MYNQTVHRVNAVYFQFPQSGTSAVIERLGLHLLFIASKNKVNVSVFSLLEIKCATGYPFPNSSGTITFVNLKPY